jgi:hypothetical protein
VPRVERHIRLDGRCEPSWKPWLGGTRQPAATAFATCTAATTSRSGTDEREG